MEIIKLLTFYVLLYGFGFSIRSTFLRQKSGPNIHYLEQFSLDFALGIFSITLYLFIVNLLRIEFSNSLILIIFIPSFINAVLKFVRFLCDKRISLIQYFLQLKIDFRSLIIVSSILIILVNYWISGISNHMIYPDELAVWGLFPKNYFIKKSMYFNMSTGLEHYPPFVSLLSAAYYLFIDIIIDNMVRGFSALFLFLSYLSLLGYTIRKGFNIFFFNVLFYFVATFGLVFGVVASAYADMAYMFYFSFGAIYLIEYFEKYDRDFFVYSILLLSCTTWIKLDGLILLPIFYAFLMSYQFINKKSLKGVVFNINNWLLVSLTVLPGLIWQIFYRINFLTSDKSPLDLENFKFQSEYIEPMFKSMWDQISSNPVFLLIVISIILVYILAPRIKQNRLYLVVNLTLSILSVYIFHIFAYLLLFKIEASTAASFIRYMSKILPLGVIIMLVLYEVINDIVFEKN